MRKLPAIKDRLALTHASARAHRMISGRAAEPGLLGRLVIVLGQTPGPSDDFPEEGELNFTLKLDLKYGRYGRPCTYAAGCTRAFTDRLLSVLPRLARAFSSVSITDQLLERRWASPPNDRDTVEAVMQELYGATLPAIARSLRDANFCGALDVEFATTFGERSPKRKDFTPAFSETFFGMFAELERLGNTLPAFSVVFGPAYAFFVPEALATLRSLTAAGAPSHKKRAVPCSYLTHLTRLASLKLSVRHTNFDWAEPLRALPLLTSLDLVLQIPSEQKADLSDFGVDDEEEGGRQATAWRKPGPSISYLARLPGLRNVSILGLSAARAPELTALASLSALESLSLVCMRVVYDAFPSISLPSLTRLVIESGYIQQPFDMEVDNSDMFDAPALYRAKLDCPRLSSFVVNFGICNLFCSEWDLTYDLTPLLEIEGVTDVLVTCNVVIGDYTQLGYNYVGAGKIGEFYLQFGAEFFGEGPADSLRRIEIKAAVDVARRSRKTTRVAIDTDDVKFALPAPFVTSYSHTLWGPWVGRPADTDPSEDEDEEEERDPLGLGFAGMAMGLFGFGLPEDDHDDDDEGDESDDGPGRWGPSGPQGQNTNKRAVRVIFSKFK